MTDRLTDRLTDRQTDRQSANLESSPVSPVGTNNKIYIDLYRENGHAPFWAPGDKIIITIAGAQLHHRANKLGL